MRTFLTLILNLPTLILPCVFDTPRLPDDGNFDFSRVFQLLFYAVGYAPGHVLCFKIGHFFRRDEDAYLSASLQGVCLFDAGEGGSDSFEFRKTLQIVLN